MPAAIGNLSGSLLARGSWEKPRSESSRCTPRKCVWALQTRAIKGRHELWGKLYNLCRVLKSIAIAVFAVMNGPDPHMTKLSKVKHKSWFLELVMMMMLLLMLMWVGIHLHCSNRLLLN